MPDTKTALYQHVPHPHTPRNPNAVHQAEQAQGGPVQRFNTWLAVHATIVVSSMACFYFFVLVSASGFPGIPWLQCTPQAFVAWFSSQFLQLILLPLIAVGTAIVGRKQELQADELYQTAQHNFHDTEQMLNHLDAQDAELLKQSAMLARLLGEHAAPTPSPIPVAPKPTNTPPHRDARGRYAKKATTPKETAA
jgi:hypothetical protein